MQRLKDISNSYRGFFQMPPFSKKKPVIGVCAVDVKARSKPMRNILNRIISGNEFDVIIFGDKVLLDEQVEDWPNCDILISFFSSGFPIDKAIAYYELRQPFSVNDLYMQKVLFDRRLILMMLEHIGVPTPERLIVNRDGGIKLEPEVFCKLPSEIQEKLKNQTNNELKIIDQDTVEVDGKILVKPFVEKPVDGEDHNINIYYHSSTGGGTRRLFRKVANQSSQFLPEHNELRLEGSFVYEKFVDVDNPEDVKVYTVGPSYAHAETRKSPVVDGVVRRNVDGKEMRFVTELSSEEQEMASKICMAFGQRVCGLDMLRAGGQSYVIDVNGWSFVKGNDQYYDESASILREMFQSVSTQKWFSSFMKKESSFESPWTLKGFVSVFRHADRTPKQKAKFKLKSLDIAHKLKVAKEELILRNPTDIANFESIVQQCVDSKCKELKPLQQIQLILEKKGKLPSTKVQIKPNNDKLTGDLVSIQVIIKWGGEFTHAAIHHSSDLGENMRKDLTIINKALLEDVLLYSSSERRVIATADAFAKSFLNKENLADDFITIKKDMLDDSNNAKEQMDYVKAELREVLKRSSLEKTPFPGVEDPSMHPRVLADAIKAALIELRTIMRTNFHDLPTSEDWCCNDNPQLFKERWEKLILEFCDVEDTKFDPGKVCELYDSLKYDALHNRDFLERIFATPDGSLQHLKLLYKNSKTFFDMIAPREYGITDSEKLSIGMLTSGQLLKAIVKELVSCKEGDKPASRLYFTKESHVHTLLNIVLNCGLPIRLKPEDIGEMDYLAQITFELYECQRENQTKEWSLRLGFSPGAHHSSIMDLQMDDRHALSVAPRRDLTDHIPLSTALDQFSDLLITDFVTRPISMYIEPDPSFLATTPTTPTSTSEKQQDPVELQL